MWDDKKQSPQDIDEALNSSLKDLVSSRPSMDGSSGRISSSGIPPVKPAAAAATMPLYPIPPDSDDDSEEFDFKKIAASAAAAYPNGDGDKKMAAVPSAPHGASNGHNMNGSSGGGDFKMAPMAPGHDDDYEDRMAKKMAANPASLKKPPPSYSSAEPPRKLTPEEKIQEKIRQEDAMRASARQNSASFLTRPDRMEDKMLMEKKKAAYYNTGTSTPGAQSVAPPPQANTGPSAEVTRVQTAETEEQHQRRRSSIKQEDEPSLMMYGVMGVAVVVVIVVIAVAVMVLSGGGDDGGDSAPQTEAPVPLTPNEEYVLTLLPEQSQLAIDDAENSPQAQAWRWLAGDSDDLTAGKYSNETIYQRFALATLYFATNGPAWKDNDLWLDRDTHECSWWGAAEKLPCDQNVSGTEYVGLKHLALTGNGLSGTLPPQVGLLTSLETLNLDDNELQGAMPFEIGKMNKITKIDLTSNKLTGIIPITMGNLMNMDGLYLEQNELTGNIPRALAETPLRFLFLGSNKMKGTVYPELCSIRQIRFDCSPQELCGCGDCDGC